MASVPSPVTFWGQPVSGGAGAPALAEFWSRCTLTVGKRTSCTVNLAILPEDCFEEVMLFMVSTRSGPRGYKRGERARWTAHDGARVGFGWPGSGAGRRAGVAGPADRAGGRSCAERSGHVGSREYTGQLSRAHRGRARLGPRWNTTHPCVVAPFPSSPPLSSLAQAETLCRPPTTTQPSLGLPLGRDASADGQHTRYQGKKHRDVRHGADLPLLDLLIVPPAACHRTAHGRPPQCDFLRCSRQRHQIPPHSPTHNSTANRVLTRDRKGRSR